MDKETKETDFEEDKALALEKERLEKQRKYDEVMAQARELVGKVKRVVCRICAVSLLLLLMVDLYYDYEEKAFYYNNFSPICEEITKAGIPIEYDLRDIRFLEWKSERIAGIKPIKPIHEGSAKESDAYVFVGNKGTRCYLINTDIIGEEQQKDLLRNIIRRVYGTDIGWADIAVVDATYQMHKINNLSYMQIVKVDENHRMVDFFDESYGHIFTNKHPEHDLKIQE